MEPKSPILKSLKSSPIDVNNLKNCITCENVPESLFDAATAKKHFSKFGKVQRIRLFPKRLMCMIEYESFEAAKKAVLNAGAFDGFMFDVSRSKPKIRRHSKKDDDPDWVPDSEVEKELSAMSGTPIYRLSRQQPMDQDKMLPEVRMIKPNRFMKSPTPKLTKTFQAKVTPVKPPKATMSDIDITDSPAVVAITQTSLSTSEAASELYQLATRVSHSADEQWRTLDARDRVLRCWGGAGPRVKVGGATVGSCPDMCPEKERLHRQAEHQVMSFEATSSSDSTIDPLRAVKQYSRSSADQEMPMCYELRPPTVLMRTCSYLLNNIADSTQQVSLADWFHFLWDRFRSIRKDIAQQALCCAESIQLIEMCARFHAHCAARLADLEHTQFDQKLNTDNLTKCLQTLKHMYADVTPEEKPRESEFRGYIALLNLGDANFWWEIKQLPTEIQKSRDITFAIKVFNALDNNNYVRFFRLIRSEATYLQACILLRYFNDVRARALARLVKAFAPRGGSKYPVHDLMNVLQFENFESMKSFVIHYGLRISVVDDPEMGVILDRKLFIEDSEPYPISRSINLIEFKRNCRVGEIIAGGPVPSVNANFPLYTSFNKDGTLRKEALIGEDLGYNTVNDTNKDVQALKIELHKLLQSRGKISFEAKPVFAKPNVKITIDTVPQINKNTEFLFNPAIPVASKEVVNTTPEKDLQEAKSLFSFSKPQESENTAFVKPLSSAFVKPLSTAFVLSKSNIFMKPDSLERKDETNIFSSNTNHTQSNTDPKSIFGAASKQVNPFIASNNNNIFNKTTNKNFVTEPKAENIFANNVDKTNIFENTVNSTAAKSIFGSQTNGVHDQVDSAARNLFKNSSDSKEINNTGYSIFQSKNKDTDAVAKSIFSAANNKLDDIYNFNQNDDINKDLELQKEREAKKREEQLKQELKLQELRKQEELRLEAKKKEEEEVKRLAELKKEEDRRKQEESKRKLEEEMKEKERKRLELEKQFKEKVERDASDLVEEILRSLCKEELEIAMKEEKENYDQLMLFAKDLTKEIVAELSNDICVSELMALKHRTEVLFKKWFAIWKIRFRRNRKRKNLIDDTPVWLSDDPPLATASKLRRMVERPTLRQMNAFHRGYVFTGEPNLPKPPEPYNLMEIIKTPLLKRMNQINYPYDKCFFWKLTVVTSGESQYFYKKIHINQWINYAFCDKRKHNTSDSLIHVGKYSWNNLMDFAISVSVANDNVNEAIEGTNSLLLYLTEYDSFVDKIKLILKNRYTYQVLPLAIIAPADILDNHNNELNAFLNNLLEDKSISKYKIFTIVDQNVDTNLYTISKIAMKWLVRNYPAIPPLEIDRLKSICQRYLANELWHKLKQEKTSQLQDVMKDINKLVDIYNFAVDKLILILTDETLLNFPPFALEFNAYLDQMSPYPKPHEFIPSNVRNCQNMALIRDMMRHLKLPYPNKSIQQIENDDVEHEMRSYCKQLGWFEDPDKVVCKVVATLPQETLVRQFPQEHFENYDLLDLLNIIIYEKINCLKKFDNIYAMYEKSKLADYSKNLWMFEMNVVAKETLKLKAFNEDDLDFVMDVKRRKLDFPQEYLMLEEKDTTLVEEELRLTSEKITKLNTCSSVVKQLELTLEAERNKSIELENLLKAALADVSL